MSYRIALLGAAFLTLGCKGGDELPPTLSISTAEIDFGTVAIGSSAERDFTLSNGGGGAVEILSVQLVEGDSDLWTLDREGSMLLGDGLELVVTVSFSPEDEERSLGLIQVRYDDGASGSVTVDLSGEGSPSEADDDGDGWRVVDGDCNDGDASVYPGAEEICDGRDNDCSGAAGSDEADADGDGVRVCSGDCDDSDSQVKPGAVEICDGKDSDCDGEEADDVDADGDGASICQDDCDDSDPLARPDGVEVCDGVDNDCDGGTDNLDADGDGHSICSEAGDCDDSDKKAYPVVVDASWTGTESGTDDEPYNTLTEALDNLDRVCQTVWIADGSYTLSETLSRDTLTLEGESEAGVVISPEAGSRHLELKEASTLTLRTLTLSGADVSGDGGALRVVDSTLTLDQVTLSGNTCSGDGGALAASSSTVTVTDSSFTSNTANDDGGAVSLLSASFSDTGSSYSDNLGVRGGAIVSDSSQLLLDEVAFRSNAASDKGGGVAVIGGSGLQIERCEFALNSATGQGGALSFTDVQVADGVVRNNLIQDNNGGQAGGGVSVSGSSASFALINNTLVSNLASDEGGGLSVSCGEDGELDILANLIYRSEGDSGFYLDDEARHVVGYNTVYASSAGSSSNYDGAVNEGSDDNTAEDPAFTSHSNDRNPDNDDLTLSAGSPAINSGPSSSEYNDRDGSQNDRGYTGGPAAKE